VSKTYVGHEIIPVYHNKYDLLQWAHVSALFRDTRPDAVVHLAAKVGGVKANMAAPATFFMENCVMNTHVLEACLTYKVKKLVCFLSTCIFPDGLGVPLEPKLLHAGPPHDSNYGYAYAKRMLAVQCRAYNEQYGTNFVSVIPSNIYGPHDNFHPENSHVVPALILKFWEAHLAGKDVTLWGNGKPFREFIYSHDVANLCMKVLLEYARKDPIILSTGREHTIAELAATIATSIGFKGQIHYDTSKPSGQYRKNSDNKPLLEQWPDYQFTDLTGGIGQTVSWFQRVYPYVRGIAL
jgi:GDP-L-fucose synthase